MKPSLIFSLLIALLLAVPVVTAQSLQQGWEFSYEETAPGKQLDFFTPPNSGTDASVAFVATRSDGGGVNSENQIFWLKANDDGTSPAAPLWTSGWLPSGDFIDIVAVRKNHLVYIAGRELRSVTIDGNGAATANTVQVFAGPAVTPTIEAARAPGFVFVIAAEEDKSGFTLRAFRFAPAPPAISGVPTFTAINGGSLSISFQTESGINYQVQSSTTLTAASWQNEGGVIAGNGQIQTVLQAAGVPRLFFRVVAL